MPGAAGPGARRRPACQDSPPGTARRTPGYERQKPASLVFMPDARSAGVCAFSPTSRITQRDGTTGRDAPDNCTLLYPGDPGPHRPAPPRRSRASGRLPEPPACSMIPGWRPPPGPGSPGIRRHPGGSPAIPEPGPRTRRHPGVPAGLPFTPCAVTLEQFHRQGDDPRAAGTTDGDASAPRQSRKTLSAALEDVHLKRGDV
jgi:hypothetical protein